MGSDALTPYANLQQPPDPRGPIYKSIVNISNAQVLAFNTTAVLLVAARPGLLIEPVLYRCQYLYGGTIFGGDGGPATVKWGTQASNDSLLNAMASGAYNSYQSVRAGVFSILSSNLQAWVGQPLNLGPSSGPYIGGNGTFVITTFYRLTPVL